MVSVMANHNENYILYNQIWRLIQQYTFINFVFTSSTFCSIHSGNLSSLRKMRVWSRAWPSRSCTWSGLTPRPDLHLLHLRSWLEAASAMISQSVVSTLQQRQQLKKQILFCSNFFVSTTVDDEKSSWFFIVKCFSVQFFLTDEMTLRELRLFSLRLH